MDDFIKNFEERKTYFFVKKTYCNLWLLFTPYHIFRVGDDILKIRRVCIKELIYYIILLVLTKIETITKFEMY